MRGLGNAIRIHSTSTSRKCLRQPLNRSKLSRIQLGKKAVSYFPFRKQIASTLALLLKA